MTRAQALDLLIAIDSQCRKREYPPGLYLFGLGNRAEELIDVVIAWHEANQPESMR